MQSTSEIEIRQHLLGQDQPLINEQEELLDAVLSLNGMRADMNTLFNLLQPRVDELKQP